MSYELGDPTFDARTGLPLTISLGVAEIRVGLSQRLHCRGISRHA